jgi:hypothetical protein
VNRVLAVVFLALWLVPFSALLQLPPERAALYSGTIGMLLEHTKEDAKFVGSLLKSEAANETMVRDRRAAEAIASDPQLIVGSMWWRWSIEVLAAVVGLSGVRALWYRSRYWRPLTSLGIAAFAAVVGLHWTAKLLWMSSDSWRAALWLLDLHSRQLSTTLTHLLGPIVLAILLGYVAFARSSPSKSPD